MRMQTFFSRYMLPVLGLLAIVATQAVAQALGSNGDMVMAATVGATVGTLMDWAKRLDPDGKVPNIVEMLSLTNEVLDDMQFVQGNLPTGHRTTIRTGLPTVYWRILNQGVPSSKSTTAQVDESSGILEAWSEVDVELADLNGNTNEYRMSEAQAFIEAMNIEAASTIFYGNGNTAPEEFTGLSPRYASPTDTNGSNVIDAGGSGSDNMSIWLVVWGAQTVHGIFPKGSVAGLTHKDHGEVTVETTTGIGGSRMRAYQDQWTWKLGLVVKDWRYAVRIGSIDVSATVANDTNSPDLIEYMIKSIHRIPTLSMGRPVFYMNRSALQYLDLQRYTAVANGGGITYENVDGKLTPTFRGIPIRKVDALLETEAAI